MTSEGAGSRTWVGAGPGPGEKEEKVAGAAEASKVSEDLQTSVGLEANGFNIHHLQTSSPTLSIDGAPQETEFKPER